MKVLKILTASLLTTNKNFATDIPNSFKTISALFENLLVLALIEKEEIPTVY